ncbi:MAG TPA: serine/threonine-protein kinase, partial [Longimicrobium sp.]|nr:serine/threonine-protein kinase [Longimicrobium sp.]
MSPMYGDELAPGALVGSFLVEALRFRGGMSILYLARDEAGRPAALKVLLSELNYTPSALRRFHREADILRGLRHPGVVELLDRGELPDGRPYLVMEWLEGRDLAAELNARGALSPAEALALLEQVAAALEAAHQSGVIHRDLKAQNVMVLRNGRVKLVDFGIARLLDAGSEDGLTSTGRVLGTPIAMSPEQIRGLVVGPATDIYALGILAFKMLTGQLPFRARAAQELEEQHLYAPAPKVSTLAPVPAAVDAVVQRCLEKQPEARYGSALEALEALRRALGPKPPPTARGAALYLSLDAGEEPDDAALDRLDALFEEARTLVLAERFTLAAEGSGFLLATFALPSAGDAEREARRQLLGSGERLLGALETARGGASIEVAIALHVADAPQAGGTGGADELLNPAGWTRGHPGHG